MFLKKLKRNQKGLTSIIATLLIATIMITSIALTYTYIIPTIERSKINSSISTSALFLNKMDSAIQSLLYDGIGASRTIKIDAFTGNLYFRHYGLNIRNYINGAIFFPIPGLFYGLTRITIPSDVVIMGLNDIDYLKGTANEPYAIVDQGAKDPALITLERASTDIYHIDLWYRVFLYIRDTGTGGIIDVTFVVVDFICKENINGLNKGSYNLLINKTSTLLNPTAYGFNAAGDPITTSGSNFYITINKGYGPQIVYTSTGARTRVAINLLIINVGFDVIELV